MDNRDLSTHLPTWQQMANASVMHAQESLQRLMEIRRDEKEWDDADLDVDETADLVLRNLEQVAIDMPKTQEDFVQYWYRLTAALRLAKLAFSRPNTFYGRSIASIVNIMESVPQLLEYTHIEEVTP